MDNAQVRKFIELINKHSPANAWLSVSMSTPPSVVPRVWKTAHKRYEHREQLIDAIGKHGKDYHYYLRITPLGSIPKSGRGLEKDSIGSSVLWVDLDAYGRQDEVASQLQRLPQPPSFVIDTGGGLAAYWMLDQFYDDLAALKSRNKKLYQQLKALDGDACFDLARVMRIPGTWNLKREPKIACFIAEDLDRIYSLQDFEPAVLDDDDIAISDIEPADIPAGFKEAILEKRHKLWMRIEHAEGAQASDKGDIDYSRNDWSIACALFNMGYDAKVILAVLMHPSWASGTKYRRTGSPIYAMRTVSRAQIHSLGPAVSVGSEVPAIYVPQGAVDIETLVDGAFEFFTAIRRAEGNPRIYVSSSGELCELWKDPLMRKPSIKILSRHSLRRVCQQNIKWLTSSSKRDKVPTSPPDRVLDTMLARPNDDVPLLYRIVGVPTYVKDVDGNRILLTKPGYHAPSHVFYEPSLNIDAIPDDPSEEEITLSRSIILDDLLADFPFADRASKAHAVGLLLLPFVRELIDGSTPFHLVDAPIQGSGKGLCVQACLSVYYGAGLNHTSEASSDDEWRKRLLALARGGNEYLWIDNITKNMDWSSIAAALTSGNLNERVLGKSDVLNVPIRFIWCGTSNNASINDDLLRRIAYIRLNWTEAGVDQPKDLGAKAFKHFPLLPWVFENRAALVRACLILCQAGLKRGACSVNKNSFESWSTVIGSILDGIGIDGFTENDKDLRAITRDDSSDRTLEMLQAAVSLFGFGAEFTAKQLAEGLMTEEGIMMMPDGIKNPAKFFGILLAQHRDRVVGGEYVVKRTGSHGTGFKWLIEKYGGKDVQA